MKSWIWSLKSMKPVIIIHTSCYQFFLKWSNVNKRSCHSIILKFPRLPNSTNKQLKNRKISHYANRVYEFINKKKGRANWVKSDEILSPQTQQKRKRLKIIAALTKPQHSFQSSQDRNDIKSDPAHIYYIIIEFNIIKWQEIANAYRTRAIWIIASRWDMSQSRQRDSMKHLTFAAAMQNARYCLIIYSDWMSIWSGL